MNYNRKEWLNSRSKNEEKFKAKAKALKSGLVKFSAEENDKMLWIGKELMESQDYSLWEARFVAMESIIVKRKMDSLGSLVA